MKDPRLRRRMNHTNIKTGSPQSLGDKCLRRCVWHERGRMKTKKDKYQARRSGPSTHDAVEGFLRRRFRWWWLIVALILVVGGSFMTAKLAMKTDSKVHGNQAQVTKNESIRVEPSADTVWDSSWPPLPHSGEPAGPIELVRAMYAYAARRPDVLQYMPCYCGCEKQGHRSNRDCFVKSKTAAGLPKWDAMGYG